MAYENEKHGVRSERLRPLPVHQAEYFSAALGANRPYAFLLPEGESLSTPSGRVYPLVVMLHGRTGNFMDWPTKSRLTRFASPYPMVFAFPDGNDGWYTNGPNGGARHEDDLIQDFLPHIHKTLPVAEPGRHWAIGGLSMGGYGAIKIALKHPDLFTLAFSHSGSLERPRTPEVHPMFGDPIVDAKFRRSEDPAWLAEQNLSLFPIRRPKLHFDCGLSDDYLEVNRRFAGHLTFIGYPHTYREMPGFHTWPYWDRAIRATLPVVAADLGISI